MAGGLLAVRVLPGLTQCSVHLHCILLKQVSPELQWQRSLLPFRCCTVISTVFGMILCSFLDWSVVSYVVLISGVQHRVLVLFFTYLCLQGHFPFRGFYDVAEAHNITFCSINVQN